MTRPGEGTGRAAGWLRRLRIFPDEPGESLAREIRASLPVVLIVSLAVFGLERLGWLSWLENNALDSALRARRGQRSALIYLVEITEGDYRTTFHDRSPIDPAVLRDVLRQIEAAHPAVIGVDLETSSGVFDRTDWPEAVWARDAEPVCDNQPAVDEVSRICPEAERFTRLRVLGGHAVESQPGPGAIATKPRSGIVLFPRDRDGVVRRYQRAFYSDSADPPSPLKGRVDSFARAIIRSYQQAGGRAETAGADPEDEHLILNFSGNPYLFPRITVGELIRGASRPYWAEKSPLRGRIVLLGGTYRAARDVYFTPVGPKYGVEIIAQAVESELTGGGIRPVNHWMALGVDLAAGLFLVILNWRIRSRFIYIIDLLFIGGASLAGSYFSFRAFGHWFNFTAVLVGVWIHLLVEKSRHTRRKLLESEEELRRATGELDAYRAKHGPLAEPSG
jgi:CHASE2 domain-containing sensor protein